MNYNIIAIVYIISLIVLTFAFTPKETCNDKSEADCESDKYCNFNITERKCENKLDDNAKYLVMIFVLLIFYLFLIKINLSYLFLDLKFRKMILIIPFLYIFMLIIIYIYLDKKGIPNLIIIDVGIMMLYRVFTVDRLNTNLINIVLFVLVTIGTLLLFKNTMLLNLFQIKKDNCSNKLREIHYGDDNIAIKHKDCPEINLDTCYSLEELQKLYKKVSKKDCSFCVDYVNNEFKCQNNAYCNKYMKQKYNKECENSKGDIKNVIKDNIEGPDYILECNELNNELNNVIELEEDINRDTTIEDLLNQIKDIDYIKTQIDKKELKNYKPVFSVKKKRLDIDDDIVNNTNIVDGSVIDLSFEYDRSE